MSLQLSLWPNLFQPWAEVMSLAHEAEKTGWHRLWVADHFMGDGGAFGPEEAPHHEAMATIAFLAGSTERIELGTLVLGASYRHPAVVANWASTMSHASNGRFTLGIGAGWQRNEHEQYGLDLLSPGARVRRFSEYSQVIRDLLRQTRSTLDGDYYQLTAALCEPKPFGTLDIMIGAKGSRMLEIVARNAEAWNMWALPEAFESTSAELDRRCELAGRDPSEIRRTTQALVCITDDKDEAARYLSESAPRASFAGTASEFAELCAAWVDVGVSEVIVPDFGLGTGDRRLEALSEIREATAAL